MLTFPVTGRQTKMKGLFRNRACDLRLSLVVFVSGMMAVASAFAQEPAHKAQPDFSEIASLMQRRVDSGVPSIAIAVAQHGKIVWEHAVGLSDKEAHRAATTRTPYYMASVSKTITATAVMALAAQHKVDLDRPINTYLRNVQITSPMWDVSQATVRRAINHTAGFSTYDRDCLDGDTSCDPSTAAAIRKYGVVVWPPGETFDYSNLGYGVLGQIVEQTSGKPLGAALKSLIFDPLGMSNCSLGPSRDTNSEKAPRYDSGPPVRRSPFKQSTAPAGSAVYCSVHDLALFGMFHLKDHLPSQKAILTDTAIDQMQANSLRPDDHEHYGLSWWIRDLHGCHGVLAQGGTSDSNAFLQLIPSEDIAVAMILNTGIADGSKIVDAVLATLLPRYQQSLENGAPSKQPSPAPPSPKPLLPELIGAWSGFVQTYSSKVPLTLTIDSGHSLVAKLGSQDEVTVVHPEIEDKVVHWSMPGSLGVEGEPFQLLLTLRLDRGHLTGAAETRPLPSNTRGFRTYFWVQLESRRRDGSH